MNASKREYNEGVPKGFATTLLGDRFSGWAHPRSQLLRPKRQALANGVNVVQNVLNSMGRSRQRVADA